LRAIDPQRTISINHYSYNVCIYILVWNGELEINASVFHKINIILVRTVKRLLAWKFEWISTKKSLPYVDSVYITVELPT